MLIPLSQSFVRPFERFVDEKTPPGSMAKRGLSR